MRATCRAVGLVFIALLVCACGQTQGPPAQPVSQPVPTAIDRPAAKVTTEGAREASPTATAVGESPNEPRSLSLANPPWKGDFDQMLARKRIRVLVPYSRTLYFNDKGRERGYTADTVRDFEAWVNRKYRRGKRPVTVVMIVTTRDKLLPGVAAGLGDIAAGNITVTAEWLNLVDFHAVGSENLHAELLVTGPGVPTLGALEDLSGRTVAVRASSSYAESLATLNRRLAATGKAPVSIQGLPEALEDEDILEMVNAGVIGITVADDWEATLWATILPRLRVYPDLALRSGARVGWAIRKSSTQLASALEDFRKNYLVKQGVSAYRMGQYMKHFRQIANPTQGEDERRFEQTKELFRKYGLKYGFDPVMLAAQGYQESRLDQGVRSRSGAIGVMQLMPSIGRELGVGDIRRLEPNIHAGAKYMDQLMVHYFADARLDEQNRTLFAFAAYNAGPTRIRQMRKLAASRGLDPDAWFNNVEIVTAEKVGMETTTYVRNIYKYYAAYKFMMQVREARQTAAERLTPEANR
jgi:membrane-bound lytic murein transglycosylase MltF